MTLVLGQMMDWGDGSGWATGWMVAFGVLCMVLFVGATALVVVLLARVQSKRNGPDVGSGPRGSSDAEGVLAERLARGEIEPVEYRERRDALRTS